MKTMRASTETRVAAGTSGAGRVVRDLAPLALMLAGLAAAPALLTGCASSGTNMAEAEPPVQQPPPVQETATEPQPEAPEPQPPATTTVRFDLDSARIKTDYRALLRRHADHLADHPTVSIVVEGHADERGPQNYNMDLGMRRARAVSALLQEAGIDARRIRLVSYGEARPQAEGHDEAAWRRNRRAEIRYPSRADETSPTPGIATVFE